MDLQAMESEKAWLVMDDLAARRLAQSLGIEVVGSLGLLLRAKDLGLIVAVRPLIEAMQREDFRVADDVITTVLTVAGEA
jgi:predicted nucleic acid-binding protein